MGSDAQARLKPTLKVLWVNHRQRPATASARAVVVHGSQASVSREGV
jgi:hypothetical protein